MAAHGRNHGTPTSSDRLGPAPRALENPMSRRPELPEDAFGVGFMGIAQWIREEGHDQAAGVPTAMVYLKSGAVIDGVLIEEPDRTDFLFVSRYAHPESKNDKSMILTAIAWDQIAAVTFAMKDQDTSAKQEAAGASVTKTGDIEDGAPTDALLMATLERSPASP